MISLTLELDDKTVRKLRALAMLSGKTVPALEKEFSQYFDRLLTQEIAVHLDMDTASGGVFQGIDMAAPGNDKTVSYTATFPVDSEEVSEPINGDLDHSLSGDVDEGQESLEEQYQREVDANPGQEVHFKSDPNSQDADQISFGHLKFPDAGQDSEAFLDDVLGQPQYQDEQDHIMRERPTAARMGSGAGRKPRVKIGDFTGDESSSF